MADQVLNEQTLISQEQGDSECEDDVAGCSKHASASTIIDTNEYNQLLTSEHLAREASTTSRPWEWMLEKFLDVEQLSPLFFKGVIGFVPHVEEPRISRLLQMVALRFLDDVVRSRKVDASAIPLIQFILKEHGVSNLRRIRSLKESLENSLIVRVQTEAVLANLRFNAKDGRIDWDAYEEALENVFPEDTCVAPVLERRNELFAVLEDGLLKSGCQREVCEHLLKKYSLEELIKDIAEFVQEKRKRCKTQFLIQLSEDIHGGAYTVLSGLDDDTCGDSEVPNVLPPATIGLKESNLNGNQSASRVDASKAALEIGHDGSQLFSKTGLPKAAPEIVQNGHLSCSKEGSSKAAPDTVHGGIQSSCRAESSKAATETCHNVFLSCSSEAASENVHDGIRSCSKAGFSNGAPEVGHDLTDCGPRFQDRTDGPGLMSVHSNINEHSSRNEDHGNSSGDAGAVDGGLQAEMLFRMAEVDMFANGIATEINGLVNEISTFAEGIHSSASITTACLEKASTDACLAGESVSLQANSEAVGTTRRVKPDILHSVEKHVETSSRVDDHLLTGSETLEGCRAGDTIMNWKRAKLGTPRENWVNKGLKKSAGTMLELTDEAITAKCNASEVECEGQGENKRQCCADDNNVSMSSPTDVHEDLGEPVKRRMSIGSEDTATFMVNDDICSTPDKGKRSRKRMYLPRVSKELHISPSRGESTAGDRRLSNEVRENELNSDCYLCGRRGGLQTLCQGCPVSVHELCLIGLSMISTADKFHWHCPCCVNIMAEESVALAKEDVKKAQETFRMAVREAVKSREMLADFLSARGVSSRDGYLAGNSSLLDNEHGSRNPRRTTKDSRDYRAESDSGELVQTLRSRVQALVSVSTLENSIQQDSRRYTCASGKYGKLQTDPQTTADDVEAEVAGTNFAGTTCVLEHVSSRQESVSVPSLPVVHSMQVELEQDSVPDQTETPGGLGTPKVSVPPIASVRNSNCDRSAFQEEARDGDRDGIIESKRLNPAGEDPGPANDHVVNRVGDEGDGHDGDLEEVCEGSKAVPDGNKRARRDVKRVISEPILDISDVEASPQQAKVYRGRKKIPGVRRRSLPWTREEEDVLKEGVKMFSNGGEWGFQWKRILDFGDGKFHESRTSVDLKDKWRNMMKAVAVS